VPGPAGEQELEVVQRSMVGSALEQQRLQQELNSTRAAAMRLNGRISDLVQAEQVRNAPVFPIMDGWSL
jgi:hypothetical protein